MIEKKKAEERRERSVEGGKRGAGKRDYGGVMEIRLSNVKNRIRVACGGQTIMVSFLGFSCHYPPGTTFLFMSFSETTSFSVVLT